MQSLSQITQYLYEVPLTLKIACGVQRYELHFIVSRQLNFYKYLIFRYIWALKLYLLLLLLAFCRQTG